MYNFLGKISMQCSYYHGCCMHYLYRNDFNVQIFYIQDSDIQNSYSNDYSMKCLYNHDSSK